MSDEEQEFLTAKELAALLRVKERKVYELASNNEIPCTRALGKLLFQRDAIDRWLNESSTGLDHAPNSKTRPNVMLGSHDPLLEWSLRESKSGMAMFFDGSMDGIERFADGDGIATGLHVYEPDTKTWNIETVKTAFRNKPVVLSQWIWRERGLIFRPELDGKVTGIDSVTDLRLVPRQAEAGSQRLLEYLLKEQKIDQAALDMTPVTRTETDAALAVSDGSGDVTLGLKSLAKQYRLSFVPVMRERFDLLVDRRAWFEEPMQRFFEFCATDTFKKRVGELGGYNTDGMGKIVFNGAG
jgi:excisionase family DNA binding protein